MPPNPRLYTCLQRLRVEAARSARRPAFALAGPRPWGLALARSLLQEDAARTLWITDQQLPAGTLVRAAAARGWLGQETQALVFDAWAGLDADALGAATGTLAGGGLFLLLCPPLAEWPDYADPDHARIAVHPYGADAVTGRFLRRFARLVRTHDGIRVVTPDSDLQAVLSEAVAELAVAPTAPRGGGGPCRTPDQARAVQAIRKVALGHRRRPVVITAHRGRGKTGALGIAAAELLKADYGEIVITAPQVGAVEPAFHLGSRLLGQPGHHRTALHFGAHRFRFVPPDLLERSRERPRLVLVDEAAAIPTPLLTRLLQRHPRIVFATTEHGYEGSGRGFTLRFRRVLDVRTRGWREVRLDHPIRWAPGDPLEDFVFQALLLDAAPAPTMALAGAAPDALRFEQLDRDRLAEDEPRLRELFGLLVHAHYRTRPTDLRHLLDGINIRVWAALHTGHVAACALTAREGGFDADTAHEIYTRDRRPHGHLLPETLAAHAGIPWAPTLQCERILRIAVHPDLQGRGIGSALVRHIEGQVRKGPCDYLGTAFGATAELLRFWTRLGLRPVRMGIHRDAASGEHSAVLLKPYTEAGRRLAEEARTRFLDLFPHQLGDPLRDLEPELVALLLCRDPAERPPVRLDAADLADAASFAFGRRGYEVNLATLWRLGLLGLGRGVALEPQPLGIWVAKVHQRLDWTEVARRSGLPGRPALEHSLRETAGRLIRALRASGELGDNGNSSSNGP